MIVKSLESRVKSRNEDFGFRISDFGLKVSSNPQSAIRNPQSPRGMTLIELLVVIIIMTTIVAAAIPLMAPSNDERRIREAARTLNTYITGAQARAVQLGRPFGIALKRLGQDTNKNGQRPEDNAVCLELFYVEQQPPYAGFDANSRACVAIHPNTPGFVLVRFVTRGLTVAGLPPGWEADLFPAGTIRPGDVIEFNGTRFELLANDNYDNIDLDANTGYFVPRGGIAIIVARPVNDSGQQINPKYDNVGREIGVAAQPRPPYWTAAAPYKVLRQATPASDEPYQLPEGTAIDLRASGVGRDDYFYNPDPTNLDERVDNSEGVLIMFAPEGRVERVALRADPQSGPVSFDEPVVENVFLLVGQRVNAPAPAAGSDPTLNSSDVAAATTDEARAKLREPVNWLNGTSKWIVIGSQSGRIATIENAFVDPLTILNDPNPSIAANPSTEEMRTRQIYAAREFTREMGQVGGR